MKKKMKARADMTIRESLRSYLRSVRDDRGWRQIDLADHLGVSKATIEKFEHGAGEFHKVESVIHYLATYAELSGMGVPAFVSVLLGELNEVGEKGGAFANEIASIIGGLSNISQVHLRTALNALPRRENECDKTLSTFLDAAGAKGNKRTIYQKVQNLTDAQLKAVASVIEAFDDGGRDR